MIHLRHAALSLALFACTPQAERLDSVPAPMTDTRTTTGTVSVVGSVPLNVQVVLRTSNGESFRLTGPLEEELRRLSGVMVAVRGEPRPSPDPIVGERIEVEDYEIVSVDGEPVVMGEVVGIEGDWIRLRTRSGEEVYLSGAPPELEVGQKIWVQGRHSIAVQSYGTIRP